MTRQSDPKKKSFHIHDLNVDTIRSIRVLAAEVGLTHADIIEMAVRRYKEGR